MVSRVMEYHHSVIVNAGFLNPLTTEDTKVHKGNPQGFAVLKFSFVILCDPLWLMLLTSRMKQRCHHRNQQHYRNHPQGYAGWNLIVVRSHHLCPDEH